MSIVLYKPGGHHNVRGFKCDILVCNPHSYIHLLDSGWFLTPEECYPKDPELVEVPEEIPEPELSEDELKEDAIRKSAKDAGIEHWWNKSIERLIDELKEQEDAE